MKVKKLHIGCGDRDFGDDWIHIDGNRKSSHINYTSIEDLSQFKNNTIDLIYASHVLEYFSRGEVILVLNEWKRVLKEGGVLRLAVPDFYEMTKLYLDGRFPLESFLGPLYGEIIMADKFIYHKTVYDFNSLANILHDVGFSDIKRYDWRKTEHSHFDDCSQAYLPKMDKENGTLISLNLEAIK